jgi:hypothetical protein
METKKFKAIKTGKAAKTQVNTIANQDKWKHTSHYKRVPIATGSAVVAKYSMVDGVPHKMVDGVLVPLTKKA